MCNEHLILSTEAEEARRLARAPLPSRKPVGYAREFLENYQPNVTFLLPEETRRQLALAGRSRPENWRERMLVELSWNSSRLEMNSYALPETERLVLAGEAADGKERWETRMVLNHKAAIQMLLEHAGEGDMSPARIFRLHELLAEELLAYPGDAGAIRDGRVGVGGTVYFPMTSRSEIEACFNRLLEVAADIEDPFEQGFFVFCHIAYLQPFVDVNKRVSRLALSIPLLKAGLRPMLFAGIPRALYIDGIIALYEQNRVEILRDLLVWSYARESGG